MRVTIRTPATTSNLGAGFDCFGLALNLYNEVTLSERPEGVWVDVEGEGASTLPRNESNLIFRAAMTILARAKRRVRGLSLRCVNRIPTARGLGSSSSAILAGLIGGAAFAGMKLSHEDLMERAMELEPHPDNLAACLHGGLTLSCIAEGGVRVLRLPFPPDLKLVVTVPDFEVPTERARAILPKEVARGDAVFNLARSALFVACLWKEDDRMLRIALEDRLHQPFRKGLIPGFDELADAMEKAGAVGSVISGSGPTVLTLTRGKTDKLLPIGPKIFRRHGLKAQSSVLDVDHAGLEVRKDRDGQ
ncbi:MAG: homoserine kinase [Planctomycetes bacterium]|nr:homoserine kinase [Planctomycetota bacterium]